MCASVFAALKRNRQTLHSLVSLILAHPVDAEMSAIITVEKSLCFVGVQHLVQY